MDIVGAHGLVPFVRSHKFLMVWVRSKWVGFVRLVVLPIGSSGHSSWDVAQRLESTRFVRGRPLLSQGVFHLLLQKLNGPPFTVEFVQPLFLVNVKIVFIVLKGLDLTFELLGLGIPAARPLRLAQEALVL